MTVTEPINVIFNQDRIARMRVDCFVLSMIVLLVLLAQTGYMQNRPMPSKPGVRMIGEPKWWIVPNQEGNTTEGKLYFGAILQNDSDLPVRAGLSFQSYLADGTKYEGCYLPGGGGPGVTVEIAPYEKALLVCHRAIVRRDLKKLQVTSRLWEVYPLRKINPNAKVVESGLIKLNWALDKEHSKYDAFARVRTLAARDTRARVLFRFYSEDKVQVATCESDDVFVEPEVILRTTCFVPIFVDFGSPQPKTVRAEIRPANW